MSDADRVIEHRQAQGEVTGAYEPSASAGAPAEGSPTPAVGSSGDVAAPDERASHTPGSRDAGGVGGTCGAAGDSQDGAEVRDDLDELVRTARQRDEYLALAQRTQADFENYRKRVAREAKVAQERGAVALAKELLPALDNLDRAIEAAAKDDPLLEGVRLVRSELAAALARVGIEAFSPVGEQFDPALHEAVATAPAPTHASATAADGGGGAAGASSAAVASGTVIEVYQSGYRLGDSVIRPARVVVAA